MIIDSKHILEARERIEPYVLRTPLVRSAWLSERTGAEVYLKLENRQRTGSFKVRGAANKILSLSINQLGEGVLTASNGNHGLAVATVAAQIGVQAEVYVSASIDEGRLARMKACGAKVTVLSGDCLDAETQARNDARETGRVYVSPYNDSHVIAGQGTMGIECVEEIPAPDAVFVAVGGGGLIGGIGACLRSASPKTRVIGCWPENAPALYGCLSAGRIIDVPEHPTLSKSTAGGIEPGAVTFDLARQVVQGGILVTEEEILDALRGLFCHDHELVEGAAGVAVAGFLQTDGEYAGRTVILIICGGNVDAAAEALIRG